MDERRQKVESGWRYVQVGDGEVEITGPTTLLSGTVVVPDTLGGMEVVSLGANALSCQYEMRELVIPGGVTNVGENAVSNCPKLFSVEFPSMLGVVPAGCFMLCESLRHINASRVNEVGRFAFFECALESFDCSTVTVISDAAFLGNTLLRQVDAPKLQHLGAYSFYRCGLKRVKLSPYLRCLPNSSFAWNRSLRSVSVMSTLPSGVDADAFAGCPKSLMIKSPSTSVGDYCRQNGYEYGYCSDSET